MSAVWGFIGLKITLELFRSSKVKMLHPFLAILLLGFICWSSAAPAKEPTDNLVTKFDTSKAGQALPAFVFQDIKGQQLKLTAFAGKPVLLNIWATWCAPCVAEMLSLDRLQAQLGKDKVTVITLALDRAGASKVPAFFRRYGIKNLDPYLDPSGQTMFTLQLQGLPTSYVIDTLGQERARVAGEVNWSDSAVISRLEELWALNH